MAPSEAARLTEIRSLDLKALRGVIDRVTRLARGASGADHAYVVLAEEDHVWHSGFDGMPESIGPSSDSTTARHIADPDTIWSEDLARDWPDHPWVSGSPHARGYANAPIIPSPEPPVPGLPPYEEIIKWSRERVQAVAVRLAESDGFQVQAMPPDGEKDLVLRREGAVQARAYVCWASGNAGIYPVRRLRESWARVRVWPPEVAVGGRLAASKP